MKEKRHIKSFNEHGENLNISDVSDSNYTPIEDLEYDIILYIKEKLKL